MSTLRRALTSSPKFIRMSSTSASLQFTMKPLPPKSHHHVPPDPSALPHGYALAGLHVGIKKDRTVPDLAVILSNSPRPTSAAATFTRNAFRAAPVTVSEDVLVRNGGRARAVVVNSGCANAVTGKQGLDDAWAMVRATDALLPPSEHKNSDYENETLVMSTGVIGQTLPIGKILSGISSLQGDQSALKSDPAAWERAARAFMTTDTFPKLRARVFSVNGREYRMAGMDKGAGMIHPDMRAASTPFSSNPSSTSNTNPASLKGLHATLLGCILTDAPVSPRALQSALAHAVDRSFNAISVDGDMSTNDTVLLLANGAAAEISDAEEIDEAHDPEAYLQFRDALTDFAAELAQLVVRDGEGATKFVTVSVEGAATYSDAHAVAARIATSALVKTALYGEDANWGRILAATGSLSTLSAPIDPTRVSVSFVPADGTPPLALLVAGEPAHADEARASEIIQAEDLEIRVELGIGAEKARYWTCDFSYEYVRINGDYRS